ncbi:MAG TPA: insulinase family protein, partial [Xanthobacteraceae bacterium]
MSAPGTRGAWARALRALAAGALLLVAAPAAVLALASPAAAMTIERLMSPGGIEAWLVRDHALPLIALEFAFVGSADQDPAGKPGVANMATSLLDEGAGPFD